MLISIKMATTPIYTTRAAIIIGVAVTLAVGLAIGSTFIANMIDANKLSEYHSNAKIVSFITLNDDTAGNKAGWNPGTDKASGREVYQFNIANNEVTENSLVYASYVDTRQLYGASGTDPKAVVIEIPCLTHPTKNGFLADCVYNENNAPKEGSQLKYIVVIPQ